MMTKLSSNTLQLSNLATALQQPLAPSKQAVKEIQRSLTYQHT